MDWVSTLLSVIITSIVTIAGFMYFSKKKILSIELSRPIPLISFKKFKQRGLAEKIQISYAGEPISGDLYVTRVTIKNTGNDVISTDDIDTKKFTFEIVPVKNENNIQLQILDLEVLNYPKNSEPTLVIKDPNKIHIEKFNFLNPKDQIDIRMLYTGGESIKLEPQFRIRGGKIVETISPTRENRQVSSSRILLMASFLALVYMMILIIVLQIEEYTPPNVMQFTVLLLLLLLEVSILLIIPSLMKSGNRKDY